MDLQQPALTKSSSPHTSPSNDNRAEDVRHRCLSAKELEDAGDYEAARSALGDVWQRVGERPKLNGLDELAQAELLLRAGTLSGWIGSSKQIEGAQETAKDLISESARIFERLGFADKLADARIDLAVCYWREGAFDEARVTLREVLNIVGEGTSEQRLRALANLALVERVSGRYNDALQIEIQSAPLFEESGNHSLRGNFHNVYAQVLRHLGLVEQREDYIDRALVEYAASSFHFEQAGHTRFQARVENNLGFLFASIGRFDEAYEHLSRAHSVFVKLKDAGSVAQVDETRARVFLAEGRDDEAEEAAGAAVRTLEKGDERSLLAEALTTQGTALARLGRTQDALAALQRAMDMTQVAGDPDSGGIVALTIIEELKAALPPADLLAYYRSAESLLSKSQHPGISSRLGECARRLLELEAFFETGSREQRVSRSKGNGSPHLEARGQAISFSETGMVCSLDQEVLHYEGDLIRRALEASGGSVTRAARLLGITHQGLAFILNGRHKDLLSVRTPIKPRRRSIIRRR